MAPFLVGADPQTVAALDGAIWRFASGLSWLELVRDPLSFIRNEAALAGIKSMLGEIDKQDRRFVNIWIKLEGTCCTDEYCWDGLPPWGEYIKDYNVVPFWHSCSLGRERYDDGKGGKYGVFEGDDAAGIQDALPLCIAEAKAAFRCP